MTHDAMIASLTRTEEAIRAAGHEPVVRAVKAVADQGVLPAGLLLSRNGSGLAVPYAETTGEAVGTGDAEATEFTATLANTPVQEGSVVITDGVETFNDHLGALFGDGGGSGRINYRTGAVEVTFAAAPANEASITAEYYNDLTGVLDRVLDTAKSNVALEIIHGTVNQSALKVGAATPAEASADDAMRLTRLGVFPV